MPARIFILFNCQTTENIDTTIFDNEDLYLLFFEDFSNRYDEIMDLLDEYMDEYEFLWGVSQQN